MLRLKLVKNGASGVGHISGVVVVAAYLILGWPRPAFSAEPAAAPDDQPHLQLAPINLSHSAGGAIGYIFQRNSYEANVNMQQSLGVRVNAGVSVNSFIWQPWLAAVSSNLVASVYDVHTNTNRTPTYNSVNTIINGDAALNLVRSSRFPFEARVFKQDDRFASSFIGTNLDNQLTGYSLRQSYRTINRRLTADAAFTSEKSTGSYTSPNYLDLFNFNSTMRPAIDQSIRIYGNTDSENQPDKGRSSSYDTLVANHVYLPNSIFSVASVANLFKMNSSVKQGSSQQQYAADSQQFSSFASLRPEKSPLTMTSSVRFLKSDSSSNGILTPTLASTNFNLGANYLFSSLIRMYGSINVADSLGIQTVSTDAALAAAQAYRAKTNLGGFLYSGSIGGSLASTNKTSTDSANQTTTQSGQSLRLYLSHALDKHTEFGAGRLSENLHQTISTAAGSSGSTVSNLNSGGSLAWTRTEGKETTLLRLSATDSRNLGGKQYVFQMVNLQASRSKAMNRNELWQGNLTVQATHAQRAAEQNSPNAANTITPSADLVYRHQRAFKVLHLSFESILRIADTNIAPAQYQGYQDQTTRTWDNNFDYKIGRLTMQLKTRVAKINNIPQSSIFFMVLRPF